MTLERIIIADDLTGALDGAAAWGPRRRTSVCLHSPHQATDTDQVVAVDTGSRHLAPAIADRMAPALRFAIDRGAVPYKKIDSLFRGHTFDEIEAACEAFRQHNIAAAAPLAVLAPAFPATGRVFVDGVVRANGRLLAGERCRPVDTLAARGVATRLIARNVIARGVEAIRSVCRAAGRDGIALVALESAHDGDLDAIRQALSGLDGPLLPIGSAGLLRSMAEADAASASAWPAARSSCAPTLFVVGSYAEIARQQVAALTATGTTRVIFAAPFDQASVERARARLRAALAVGDAIIQPDPEARVDPAQAAQVATRLADIANSGLAAVAGGRVILTGGETARAVLDRAGIERLIVDGEIEPGVVRSRAPAWSERAIVTKSGAFGDVNTLVRLRERPRTDTSIISTDPGSETA